MGDGTRLTESDQVDVLVRALWPRTAAERRAVALATKTDAIDGWVGPGEPFKDRDLARVLRSRDAPGVVVLASLSPTLLRALREAPPSWLVVTAALADDDMKAIRELSPTLVLGPGAHVRVGSASCLEGGTIACAHAADELEGLARALDPDTIALALSPTPPWLWRLLQHPRLKECRVAGYVAGRNLGSAWVRWARGTTLPHVVVPVGVSAPDLDAADDAELGAVVAAHALERHTGPVFPSPRVVALVLQGLLAKAPGARSSHEPDVVDGDPLAVWQQARRALPLTGAAVGMDRPSVDLDARVPTAAFLAQRALLRVKAYRQAVASPPAMPPAPDEEGLSRALEVLRSATQTLTDQESKVVLRGFGIEVTRQAVANSASGATGFAERIGFPVVLKALSPDLRRRTDVGGVILGLETAAAVRRAYATVVGNIERHAPTARLDGVLVAEMLPDGLDVRCGGRRLALGEVVLYGVIEGASVPLEPAFGLVPMQPQDAVALAHAVLSRVPVPALRRESDPDVHGLAEVFLRLCTLFAQTERRLESVDIGPLRLVDPPRGYVTLDARITQAPHLEGL